MYRLYRRLYISHALSHASCIAIQPIQPIQPIQLYSYTAYTVYISIQLPSEIHMLHMLAHGWEAPRAPQLLPVRIPWNRALTSMLVVAANHAGGEARRAPADSTCTTVVDARQAVTHKGSGR